MLLLEDYHESEQRDIERAKELIKGDKIYDLAGMHIGVDELQTAFYLAGWNKGSIGEEDGSWYRNVASTAAGYIAELEVESETGSVWTIVVDGIAGAMVRAIERRG